MTKRKERKKASNSSDLDASIGNEGHKPEDEDSGKAHEITMSTSKEAMEMLAKELTSQYDKKMDDRFSKFEKDFKDLKYLNGNKFKHYKVPLLIAVNFVKNNFVPGVWCLNKKFVAQRATSPGGGRLLVTVIPAYSFPIDNDLILHQ